MLAQGQDLAPHLRHDLALVLGATVLQDMLDDVVPILILCGIMGKDGNINMSLQGGTAFN